MESKEVSELDWARLAAFIDGEGSIMILERKRAAGSHPYLRVNMCNTDPRLIVWLKNTFGGSVTKDKRSGNVKHRVAYRWHISSNQAAWILESCYPYLILKREQADKALAFQSTLKGPGHIVPSHVWEERYRLRDELKFLKHMEHPDLLESTGLIN